MRSVILVFILFFSIGSAETRYQSNVVIYNYEKEADVVYSLTVKDYTLMKCLEFNYNELGVINKNHDSPKDISDLDNIRDIGWGGRERNKSIYFKIDEFIKKNAAFHGGDFSFVLPIKNEANIRYTAIFAECINLYKSNLLDEFIINEILKKSDNKDDL